MTYVKRSAEVPFGTFRCGFGKGGWGGLGLQAMRTKSVLVLILWMQLYHLHEWTKKKRVGKVAMLNESNW